MRAVSGLAATIMIALQAAVPASHAQEFLRPLSIGEERALNANRVGVVAGGPGGTYIRIANDLGLVLDDPSGYSLRVLAQTARGSVRNILDLLHLERVDIAIVQDDVLDYVGRLPAFANAGIRTKIAYITKLYDEEIHVLARNGIEKFEDLAGKRVAIDVVDSGTEMTARNLFATFDLSVQQINMPLSDAVKALIDGRIDAFIFVGGKPLDPLKNLPEATIRSAGIGFVPLPHNHPLRGGYGKATFGAADADYASLTSSKPRIETWSVSAVLAVYNWFQPQIPESNPRRRITTIFIDRFMSNFPKFCTGFTPKWREVDLSVAQPNWIRAAPASHWLSANPRAQVRCSP